MAEGIYSIPCPSCHKVVEFPLDDHLYPVTIAPLSRLLTTTSTGVTAAVKLPPGQMFGPIGEGMEADWSRQVFTSDHIEDLNCLVAIRAGEKFFLTVKVIPPGEPLRVNYWKGQIRPHHSWIQRRLSCCQVAQPLCAYNHPHQPFYDWEKFYFVSCAGCDTISLQYVTGNQLNFVPDTPVPSDCQSAAYQTIPEGLVIVASNITSAGLGVFARREIPPMTVFGPYRGVRGKSGNDHKYVWHIRGDVCVNGRDLKSANWMRFVNCATSLGDLNLLPVFYHDDVFYLAPKAIPAGKELLTDYGSGYADSLGSSLHQGRVNLPCPLHSSTTPNPL